jgi:hypothetical protein
MKISLFRRLLSSSSLAQAIAIAVAWLMFAASMAAEVVQYSVPEGIPHNDDFAVKMRASGGEWQELFEYSVPVDMHDVRHASMAYFDFAGTVEVSVTSNRGAIETARIRPLSCGITPVVKGSTLTFVLSKPCNLSVEVNGDRFHNLHVFTNPLETNVPDPGDPNVIYLKPGVHTFPHGVLEMPSGKTLYLAGGAVVKAMVRCRDVENVRIRGRGLLYQGSRGVEVTHSKNVEIDDLILISPRHYTVLGGQSQNLTIRNLRVFSHRSNSDGIDLMSCSDVLVDGVFMRNSDDCIALYGHRGGFYGDTRKIAVRNSTLWADVAHPIHIGTHGNPPHPEVIENLLFANIDILEHDEPQIDYQGCMSINVSDENLVRNIRFEDIRVEDFTQGQLVNLRVAFNKKYCTAPGRGIENVTFKNISYSGSHANISIIEGYDDTRAVKNVVFENLVINGKLISWQMEKPAAHYAIADLAGFYVGPHVEGVEFLPSGGAKPPPTPSRPRRVSVRPLEADMPPGSHLPFPVVYGAPLHP